MYGFDDLVPLSFGVAAEIEEMETRSYKAVMKSQNRDIWIQAINEEKISLNKNQTWVIVEKTYQKKY